MKVLLVIVIIAAIVACTSAVIDLQVDTKKKEHDLAFVARVRNYLTHDNEINSEYIRQVLTECFHTSDYVTNEIVDECSTEKNTPEETADSLYECIVEETKETHIDDNPQFEKESALCQLELIGFIKDGQIDERAVKQKLIDEGEDEEDADRVARQCSVDKGTSEETADNFINCLAEQYNLKQN